MTEMTDRIRFMESSKNKGCEIKNITETSHTVIALNGKMETTYFFDNKGKFVDATHKFY